MTSQSEPERERARTPTTGRRDAEASLSEDQRTLIRLLADQHAIPLDQLARFLDCSTAEALAAIDAFEEAGWIERRAFLIGDAEWYWLTRRGMQLSGTGFTAYPPMVGTLRHRRAVNAVRLHLAEHAPEGTWVAVGEVTRQLGPDDVIPDAVLEVDGERHAIEIELSCKAKPLLRRILSVHCARWDAVVYFCDRRTRPLLQRMRGEGRWPRLVVRRLPRGAHRLGGHAAAGATSVHPGPHLVRGPGKRTTRRPPEPWEHSLLQLIDEQYAVPFDQLARFLDQSAERAHATADHLVSAGFAEYGRLMVDEPYWLWLTHRGAHRAGNGGAPYRPGVGKLARIRAVNEVRLQVAPRAPRARWVSGRSILRDQGRGAHIPNAVLEIGSERHALEVELVNKEKRRACRIIDAHSARYDAVVLFCTPTLRRFFERLNGGGRWPKLVIRDLPRST